jgi:hypothetical protein
MIDTRGRSSDFLQDLGDAARKNPLSAALIGMGALWLFTSRRNGNVAKTTQDVWRSTTSVLADSARRQTDALRDRGARAVDQVSGVGASLANAASTSAGAASERAGDVFDGVRTTLGEVFRKQPLALGAVGLAIGASIAASLPSTETETAYFGDTSDYVKQKFGEIVDDQSERVVEIGKTVATAVVDEARQQGLTPEGLKAAARDLSGKVSRVADVVAKQPPIRTKPDASSS